MTEPFNKLCRDCQYCLRQIDTEYNVILYCSNEHSNHSYIDYLISGDDTLIYIKCKDARQTIFASCGIGGSNWKQRETI